jgi:hypothetical protein
MAPFPLEKGMIYSCVSLVPQFKAEDLQLNRFKYHNLFNNFRLKNIHKSLQIPVISDRVRLLALKLTKDKPTIYQKVNALNNYLKTTYPYDLNIPPFPEKAETTDYFLFEAKRGYCEHFATALAVMCRTLGIPTCLVTGYAPGTYNPFLSLYEIRSCDAHAWTEALIPGIGWLPFDPTPGFDDNPYNPQAEKSFIPLLSIFKYFKKIFSFKFSAFSGSYFKAAGLKILVVFSAPLVVLGLIWISFKFKKLKLKAKQIPPALLYYYNMLRLLEAAGHPKAKHITPNEYKLSFKDKSYYGEVATITDTFVQQRYSRTVPSTDELLQSKESLKDLKGALKKKA